MKLPSIWVYTHDSIGLGEDGPTHQPVEHLAGLRAIPRLNVVRPADANETALGWQFALRRPGEPDGVRAQPPEPADHRSGRRSPTTRSSAGRTCCATRTAASPELILIGTGSEVSLCLEAADKLTGVRGARGVDAVHGHVHATRTEAYRDAGAAAGRQRADRGRGRESVRLGPLDRPRGAVRRHGDLRRVRPGPGGVRATSASPPSGWPRSAAELVGPMSATRGVNERAGADHERRHERVARSDPPVADRGRRARSGWSPRNRCGG